MNLHREGWLQHRRVHFPPIPNQQTQPLSFFYLPMARHMPTLLLVTSCVPPG